MIHYFLYSGAGADTPYPPCMDWRGEFIHQTSWLILVDGSHKVCGGVAAALGADVKADAAGGGKKKRRGEAKEDKGDAAGGWEDEGRAVWCAHYLFASEGARARVRSTP